MDHGLYRELSPHFRYQHASLWRALYRRDAGALQEACDALGVGRYSKYFPLLFTYRPINSKTLLGTRLSVQERHDLKEEFAGFGFGDVNQFLENLPTDLLFLLRTNNLIRSINLDLGGTAADRIKVLFTYAARGVFERPPPTDEEAAEALLTLNQHKSERVLDAARSGVHPVALGAADDVAKTTPHAGLLHRLWWCAPIRQLRCRFDLWSLGAAFWLGELALHLRTRWLLYVDESLAAETATAEEEASKSKSIVTKG